MPHVVSLKWVKLLKDSLADASGFQRTKPHRACLGGFGLLHYAGDRSRGGVVQRPGSIEASSKGAATKLQATRWEPFCVKPGSADFTRSASVYQCGHHAPRDDFGVPGVKL